MCFFDVLSPRRPSGKGAVTSLVAEMAFQWLDRAVDAVRYVNTNISFSGHPIMSPFQSEKGSPGFDSHFCSDVHPFQ